MPTRRWSALALLGCLGCAESAPSTRTSEPTAVAHEAPAPDLARLRGLLAPLRDHAFTTEEQARGCPADQSLGEYLALLDRNTEPDPDEPDRVNERTGGCDVVPADAMWPPPDPAYRPCTVRAHSRDAAGESPWTYELRVRVRRDDGSLDPTWIACPGGS